MEETKAGKRNEFREGKVYKKAKANLNKQLAKVLLRIHQGQGENAQKDSDVENSNEKEFEKQEIELAPYWKILDLHDISQVAKQNTLLDKLQETPKNYATSFNSLYLENDIKKIQGHTKQLKAQAYYENQLKYLQLGEKLEEKNTEDLFERLEEEPTSANTTSIEEILGCAIGLKHGLKRTRLGKKSGVVTALDDGAELTLNNLKKLVGLVPLKIEKIAKYQIRPWKLPKFSDKFDKVDAVSALLGAGGMARLSSILNP